MKKKKQIKKWIWRLCLMTALVTTAAASWAADPVVNTTTGQVELAEGDSLTVQDGGTVAVSTTDADAIGVKGDGTTESDPCATPPGQPGLVSQLQYGHH